MAFVEVVSKRTAHSITLQNAEQLNQYRLISSILPIHAEDEAGDYQPLNMTPQRIPAGSWAKYPAFDGWLVQSGGWLFGLDVSGWVYFGGRKGEHWFRFRLRHVGYLDDPAGNPILSDDWVHIAPGVPTPNYNVNNLSRNVIESTIEGQVYINKVVVEWRNLWTTPGGGEVYLRFMAVGNRLKAEYIINAAARNWIAANATPAQRGISPANAYFAFAFEVDWDDIPRKVIDGALVGEDFNDISGGVELQNALGELLAFLPVENIYVEQANYPIRATLPMRKRFWSDANGNDYLVMGARVSQINNLPAGDLIFDPTVTPSVGSSGDDGSWVVGVAFGNTDPNQYIGRYVSTYDVQNFFRFTGVTVPNDVTVSSAYLTLVAFATNAGASPSVTVYVVDADNQAAPTDLASAIAMVEYGSGHSWSPPAFTAGNSYNTSDFATSAQAIFARGGWASGNALVVEILSSIGSGDNNRQIVTWDHATEPAPQLTVVYLTAYSQSVGGTLTVAGTVSAAMLFLRTLTGTLTNAGAMVKRVATNPAGTLGSSGALSAVKLFIQLLTGTLSTAGTLVKQTATNPVGTLVTAGATIKSALTSLSGSISPVGVVTRSILTTLYGYTTLAGNLVKSPLKAIQGVLGTAATISKQVSTGIGGTLGSSGALNAVRVFTQLLTGTLATVGTVVKRTATNPAGTLSAAGTVVKRTATNIAGTLATAGATGAVKVFVQVLTGTLGTAGTVVKQVATNPAGALSAAGTTMKQVATNIAGTLATAGATIKSTFITLGGGISPTSALTRFISTTLYGYTTLAGNLVKSPLKAIQGVLSAVSTVTKRTAVNPAGTLGIAGAINAVKVFTQLLTGTLAATGEVVKRIAVNPVGILTGAGGLTKSIYKRVSGLMTATGVAIGSSGLSQLMQGTLTLTGGLTKRVFKSTGGTLATAGTVMKRVGKIVSAILQTAGALTRLFIGRTPVERTFVIPAQNRAMTIPAMNRVIYLNSESRGITVPGEQ